MKEVLKRSVISLSGLVLLLALTSCGQKPGPVAKPKAGPPPPPVAKTEAAEPTAPAPAATPAKEEAAPTAAEPSDTIKIGAIFSVTGPAANLGAPEAKTSEMLVDKINAAGGVVGKKLQLVLKDSGGSPEKAVSFAKQLIEEDKVLAIIGPSTSGETLQIKPICEEAGMILLSCAAAELIVNPVAKYVFKTPQKDSQAVAWIYKTMKDMGISKIGVVTDNTGFGKAGKEQLAGLASAHGIEIVLSEMYDKDATDLTDILTKIKGAGVQAIVNWSIVPAQSIVAKNMKQLGMTIPLFQSHGFGNIKYVQQAGEAANGIIFPAGRLLVADTLPDDHPQKAVLSEYKKDYETRYKEDVSTFGGHAYDAIMIVAKAIEKAGTTDRTMVREAIETLQGFVGTAGIFNFSAEDHNGLGLDAFEMLTVKDGKFAVYQKPATPPAAPQAKAEAPAPAVVPAPAPAAADPAPAPAAAAPAAPPATPPAPAPASAK